MTTAFGLDLSGFSSGGSAMARADLTEKRIVVTVYTGHCFSQKVEGCDALPAILARERKIVLACLACGPLVVDIPIDLQKLPQPPSCRFAWQLVQRPVDYAFRARPPLADRLGAPLARFLAVSGPLRKLKEAVLGSNLFETYPAATLELLDLPREGYKGYAQYKKNGVWEPAPAKSTDESKKKAELAKNMVLATTLQTLRWTAEPGEVLTHDGFDAGLCAITGALDGAWRLEDPELSASIRQRLAEKMPECAIPCTLAAPRGYILLRMQPLDVTLRIRTVGSEEELLEAIQRTDSATLDDAGSSLTDGRVARLVKRLAPT